MKNHCPSLFIRQFSGIISGTSDQEGNPMTGASAVSKFSYPKERNAPEQYVHG